MSAHSPGPWRRCMASDGRCPCGLVWDASGEFVIAHVVASDENHDKPNDMFQANCYLIAAAPELLAERDQLRARVAELEDFRRRNNWTGKNIVALATERDRLRAILADTPENVMAVEAVIAGIERVEPWTDVAEAILAAFRARAVLALTAPAAGPPAPAAAPPPPPDLRPSPAAASPAPPPSPASPPRR
jgi:hypothetical protein